MAHGKVVPLIDSSSYICSTQLYVLQITHACSVYHDLKLASVTRPSQPYRPCPRRAGASGQLKSTSRSNHPNLWHLFDWEENLRAHPPSVPLFLHRICRQCRPGKRYAISVDLNVVAEDQNALLSAVGNYMAELTRSLDYAIALSYKRNPLSSKSRFVRGVLLVKGVHFYGFHSSYAPFLKIHMIDPSHLTRAVTLLKSGVVMSKKFNVFESHISFYLQFMCDFNLYGCGWLDLGEVWRRGEEYPSDEESEEGAPDHENRPAVQVLFKSSPHPTQSRMELEVDAVAFHILNRHALAARKIHHKLTIPGPELPPDPLVLSVRELWEDERRRRVAMGLDPSPELPVDPSENSRRPGGDWIAETRWWDEIKRRIEAEGGQEVPPQDKSWEKWVPTTFESLDGLWEDGYRAWKPELTGNEHLDEPEPTFNDQSLHPYDSPPVNVDRSGELSQILQSNVDETLLSSQQLEQLFDEERGRVDFRNQDLDFDENLEYEDGFLDGDVVNPTGDEITPEPTPGMIPSTVLQKRTPGSEGWVCPLSAVVRFCYLPFSGLLLRESGRSQQKTGLISRGIPLPSFVT